MNVLVTGGAGYIGSHLCAELIDSGFQVTLMDNLLNSRRDVIDKIKRITGRRPDFYEADICNREEVSRLFDGKNYDLVIHLAGLKSAKESIAKPQKYYDVNVGGTLNLCEEMSRRGIKNIIIGSSAAVYGDANQVPISEDSPKGSALTPYGETKKMMEKIMEDMYSRDRKWNAMILRFFNVMGAHPGGLLGENLEASSDSLATSIEKVALGKKEELEIFGNDYETQDGTCIRDYVHVMDVARGHLCAISALSRTAGVSVYNIASGKGCSVLEVIEAYEKVCDKKLPRRVMPRREGDVAVSYADCTRAQRELGWKAKSDLSQMCLDSWNRNRV